MHVHSSIPIFSQYFSLLLVRPLRRKFPLIYGPAKYSINERSRIPLPPHSRLCHYKQFSIPLRIDAAGTVDLLLYLTQLAIIRNVDRHILK